MKKLTIVAGVMLCAATAMPTFAQQAAPEGAQESTSYSDEQLQAFAQAAVKVQIISQQARTQMMQAIQSVEGLDMDTYNGIVQQAQTDQALSGKISQFMQEYAEDAGIETQGAPATE